MHSVNQTQFQVKFSQEDTYRKGTSAGANLVKKLKIFASEIGLKVVLILLAWKVILKTD